MNEYIIELFGDWVLNYPNILATVEIVIFVVACIFLQNLLYGLVKLLSGEK